MENLSEFCTCSDLKCRLHPTNHDKGCSLCVSRNLELKLIPNCFFNLVKNSEVKDGYTFYDFAKLVLMEREES